VSVDHLSLGKLSLQNFNMNGKEKAEVAGEQFEGYLLQMMVREMRKTIPEGMFDSQAMSVFMDLFDQAIAEEMASAGGLGFSESIQNSIKAQKGEQITPPNQKLKGPFTLCFSTIYGWRLGLGKMGIFYVDGGKHFR